jgi:hypothetical protein
MMELAIIRARFYNFCGWTIDFLQRSSPKSASLDKDKAVELKTKIDEIGRQITAIHNKMWNDITPLVKEQERLYKEYTGDTVNW